MALPNNNNNPLPLSRANVNEAENDGTHQLVRQSSVRNRVANFERKIKKATGNLRNSNNPIDEELPNDSRNLNEEKVKVVNELDNLKKENDAHKKKIIELENEKCSIDIKLKNLQKQNVVLKKQINDFILQVDNLNKETVTDKEMLKTFERENRSLEHSMKILHEENTNLKSQINANNNDNRDGEISLDTGNSNTTPLSSFIISRSENANMQIVNLENEVKDLQEKNRKLLTIVDDFERLKNELIENCTLKKENDDDINFVNDEGSLQIENNLLKKTNERQKIIITDLEDSVATLEKKNGELENILKIQERKVKTQLETIRDQSEDISTLEEKVKRIMTKCKAKDENITTLEELVVDKETTIDKLKRRLRKHNTPI